MITVSVGPKQEKIIVHQDLICRRSTFFKAALSRGWKEAQDKVVHLPKVLPPEFRTYVETIYGYGCDLSGLAYTLALDRLKEKGVSNISYALVEVIAIEALSILWIHGDYLGDVKFKNDVIDNINKTLKRKVTAATISRVFTETQPGSALQRFIVDYCVRGGVQNTIFAAEKLEECGAEFAFALIKASAAKGVSPGAPPGVSASDLNISDYHEKEGEEEEEAQPASSSKSIEGTPNSLAGAATPDTQTQ